MKYILLVRTDNAEDKDIDVLMWSNKDLANTVCESLNLLPNTICTVHEVPKICGMDDFIALAGDSLDDEAYRNILNGASESIHSQEQDDDA